MQLRRKKPESKLKRLLKRKRKPEFWLLFAKKRNLLWLKLRWPVLKLNASLPIDSKKGSKVKWKLPRRKPPVSSSIESKRRTISLKSNKWRKMPLSRRLNGKQPRKRMPGKKKPELLTKKRLIELRPIVLQKRWKRPESRLIVSQLKKCGQNSSPPK